MKKMLAVAVVLVAVMGLGLATIAGPTFDYEHNIPSNVGDVSIGYVFGDKPLALTASVTFGDVWGINGGPDLGWGFAIDYSEGIIGFETSLDFSLNEIGCWPNVYLDGFTSWSELTVHLFPAPCLGPDPCGDPVVDLVFAGGVTYAVIYTAEPGDTSAYYTPSIVPLGMVGIHVEL